MTTDVDRLRAELLAFAAPSFQPEAGFAWLDEVGQPTPGVPQFTYVTCRMTYVASLEVLRHGGGGVSGLPTTVAGLGGPKQSQHSGAGLVPDATGEGLRGGVREQVERAQHGVQLLSECFYDAVHGGWFTSMTSDSTRETPQALDTTKANYPHAFVVLAAATAEQAAIPGATELLDRALDTFFSRFWDPVHQMFVEDYSQDFTQLSEYRGLNSAMHAVEALLAAWDARGTQREFNALIAITQRVLDLAQQWQCRLPEHFSADWIAIPEFSHNEPLNPTRPYGSTPGHWCEWARLLVQVSYALDRAQQPANNRELAQLCLETAQQLFDQAWNDAWHRDGQPGMVFTVDFDGKPLARQRLHWVACEALGAAHLLHQATGAQRNAQRALELWDFVEKYVLDPRGGWHHELDAELTPSHAIRPGKADLYHAYQATLFPHAPAAPSLASALRTHDRTNT